MRDTLQRLEEGVPISGTAAREMAKLMAPFAQRIAQAAEDAWEAMADEIDEAVMANSDTKIGDPQFEREMDRAYVALRREFAKALSPQLGHGLTAK